jgi:hypothetical protein
MTKSQTLWIYLRVFLYIFQTFILMCVVIFAWFTLTNVNHTELISNVSDLESEYEFYVYKSKYPLGNLEPSLLNQLCSIENINDCYFYIGNPMTYHLLETSTAPGFRYSYAIKIRTQGLQQSYLSLYFGGINSYGYTHVDYKIEHAFLYEVIKISYVTSTGETSNYKDIAPRMTYRKHFDQGVHHLYPMAINLPTKDLYSLSSELIIYFDLYFDPTIKGRFSDGELHPDSRIFEHQILEIKHLMMQISLKMEDVS